ncbi:PREDICTED: leucine-rich repeat neuronal protein 4 [Nanorana parkeri]|uniref:leucine-rich repeat neuronal protein 4 n=1 Tax=Nanorana parkeri TaxID=125878 RepID=UPI000854DBC3|nr:PREDICTED: leucine-rich repeat neuronal protein 4 [Nanorana parkeri]
MMFCFLLLVSKMGMLAAQLNSTDQTATVSKNFTVPQNITETACRGRCNITCFLPKQSLQEFPACIPNTVQVLDLAFNNLAVVTDQDVADLFELRNLSLAHNQIKEILWGSNVLAKLMVLDLSNNQLSVVPKCNMLKNVQWLSLAGNPILHIPSFAFTCFPNLMLLNLSSTLIGSNSSADIDESAFALNATGAKKDSLQSLHLLDLSATYLHRIDEAWSKQLPNLMELHITQMINMKSLEDELPKWFPQLKVLNCSGSRELSHVRTEIFENASQSMFLSFRNCNLTSFPPWNVTVSFIYVDLTENPLYCKCELDWLLSDPGKITLFRANETYCNSFKGDMPPLTLVEYHNFCKLNQINTSENAMPNFSMSTPTNNITEIITGTQKHSVTATARPQKMEQKPSLPESVTVFKTTAADSTILSPKPQTSSIIQGTTALDTGNGSANGSTTSMNSVGGPSTDSMYTTASTLVTEVFTSLTGNTKGGSGQPLLEDSTNEEQAGIPQNYSEDYDDEESPSERSTIASTILACDYDGCRHLQTPCIEVQQLTMCLCPGLSGEDMIPDPPYLKNISEITDTSAQIHWCSPNSVVEKYQLVYQSADQNKTVDNIYAAMRQYTLYNLSPYTTYKVCMVAFNKKGQSEAENMASRTPCAEFKTRPSYIMILALLCSLGGLFLVIITVLAGCLYKTCKNNMVNQYDTHLVSYKNPAFEYHLTIPSYH